MGDSRRFDLFANLIAKQFPDRTLKIADVAGGKGYLAISLKRDQGYKNVEVFDPKRRKIRPRRIKYNKRFFAEDTADGFDLIVGMHPDEATDVIIKTAADNGVPFVVCPCCVKPTVSNFWGKHNYHVWLDYLERYAKSFGFKVQRLLLKMNGKNVVLVGRL